MVSPELLRHYPFFGFMDSAELKAVAMIADEVTCEKGQVLIETEAAAEALYLLREGSLDIIYVVTDRDMTGLSKEFYIGEINPGEITGISALIEPYIYTMTVRATRASRVIRFDAAALRALCEVDPRMAYGLMRQTAKAAMDRLQATRTQLAAERA